MRPPPPVALTAVLVAACAPAPPPAAVPRQFAVAERGRVIVQLDRPAGGGPRRRPLLRVTDVPAEWEPAAGARFRVGGDSFHLAAGTRDGSLVAWQAGTTHALLGVHPALDDAAPASGAAAPRPTILDFYFDSRASAVTWSPDGRHLLALYTGPSGSAEARLYDARRGRRLAAPWESACGPATGCAVMAARWTDARTVLVTTSAAGGPREYQVGVER
jgi:hypothetical protein